VRELNEALHATDSRGRETAQKAESNHAAAARRTMELASDIANLKRALEEHAALARKLSDATRDIDAIIDSIRSSADPRAPAPAPAPALAQSPSMSSGFGLGSGSVGGGVAAAAASRSVSGAASPQGSEVVSKDAESRLRALTSLYAHTPSLCAISADAPGHADRRIRR
jgi:hypothetical protein